jgi:predicted TIM-barrel fold metal-dependent hydrolase
MSAIDFHTHAFPDAIAGRAMAKLEAAAQWQAVAGGTVAELLKSMDAAGVEISVLCGIATKPDQAKGILAWCDQIRSERLRPLPSVHPDDKDIAGWIRRFAQAGYAGIKLHPMYQNFAADEARLEPIYSAASDAGLLVVVHCGKDLAYPDDDDRACPLRFRNVINHFPSLRLVCTHMGGWRCWDDVQRHLLGTNVLLETSFSLDELGPIKAAEMIRGHGVDKVLMGSDWPWNSQADEIARIRRLPLIQEELHKILRSNAEKLLAV